MVNFLNKIVDTLPEYQKVAIKALIAARQEELTSIRSRQEEAASIYNRVKSNLSKILLKPRYAVSDEKISSDSHNQNMQEIFLDLSSLYKSIDSIASTVKKQVVTLNSDYEKSKAGIQKLINDVKVFALRKQYPEFNEIKLIDFNASSNLSKKQPIAEINSNTRLLELRPVLNSRVHLPNRTARTTKIYTKTYSQGLKGDLSSSFPPENMVDQRPETFWATLILADSPVSQVYEKNTTTGDTYQVSVDGPIVEVYFKFSHIERINTIKILPFSEFPIKIVDVSYRPSNSSQILLPIKDFTEVTTLDWEELNFDPVSAAEVRIIIAQENYKKSSYLLPRSLVVNSDIFQKILNNKASKIIGSNILDSDFSSYLLKSINSYDTAIAALQELYNSSGIDITIQPNIEYYSDIEKLFQSLYSNISPDLGKNILASTPSAEALQQPDYNPTINISKYEYLLGLREVEISYQLYYPSSYYESEKYIPQATISQIEIEVDERHTEFKTPWQDDYRKTSTEWQIDIGAGRKIPIHPKNQKDENGIPSVKDERLNFDLSNNKAFTRLGGYYNNVYRLKKNGDVVMPDKYITERITGAVPSISITLTGQEFDTNSIYTVDYAVDPTSYSINILDRFSSETVVSPETFKGLGSDSEIEVSKFPFINYEIINLTGFFTKEDDRSEWKFTPPQQDVFSGQLFIYPTILDSVGNTVQSGSLLAYSRTGTWGNQSGITPVVFSGNSALSLSYFGELNGVEFGYFVKIMDSSLFGELSSFASTSGLVFKQPITVTEEQCRRWDSNSTGMVFQGSLESPVSGYLTVDYTLGIGVKTDDQIFALTNLVYNPITVTVGGTVAKNITDYVSLTHPAFSIGSNKDNEYQYIQAGKKIYFNQKNNTQEIKVTYNWLSEYVSLLSTLKFNGPINPSVTPKVNEARIFLNNLVIVFLCCIPLLL